MIPLHFLCRSSIVPGFSRRSVTTSLAAYKPAGESCFPKFGRKPGAGTGAGAGPGAGVGAGARVGAGGGGGGSAEAASTFPILLDCLSSYFNNFDSRGTYSRTVRPFHRSWTLAVSRVLFTQNSPIQNLVVKRVGVSLRKPPFVKDNHCRLDRRPRETTRDHTSEHGEHSINDA